MDNRTDRNFVTNALETLRRLEDRISRSAPDPQPKVYPQLVEQVTDNGDGSFTHRFIPAQDDRPKVAPTGETIRPITEVAQRLLAGFAKVEAWKLVTKEQMEAVANGVLTPDTDRRWPTIVLDESIPKNMVNLGTDGRLGTLKLQLQKLQSEDESRMRKSTVNKFGQIEVAYNGPDDLIVLIDALSTVRLIDVLGTGIEQRSGILAGAASIPLQNSRIELYQALVSKCYQWAWVQQPSRLVERTELLNQRCIALGVKYRFELVHSPAPALSNSKPETDSSPSAGMI